MPEAQHTQHHMPSMNHLEVFGSRAFTYIPKEKWTKMDLRTEQVYIDEKEKSTNTDKVDIRESIPTKENKARQPETVQLSTTNHTDDTPAEPQEPQGAAVPYVRQSTGTNSEYHQEDSPT
ncbi:UNVERIFIED_CONTAM: hypothetical protein K2H54_051748 [Gekko kuhli]